MLKKIRSMPADDEATAVNSRVTTSNISLVILFFKANHQVNGLIFLIVLSEKKVIFKWKGPSLKRYNF